ncbi:MCE family protein [Mycolicibacterium moriokaense]|nr:MCE family protein [Mycolicibacterium moriokaense]
MNRRAATGVVAFLAMSAIVVAAAAQFRGDFTETVPVTVLSDRAGLLMDPGARVKLNGAQIGKVSSVRQTPEGGAALTLAIDPSRMSIVPDNVLVDIGSSTVFGAKSVEFVPPQNPSSTHLRAGQVLDSQHVTVEVNTIFEQLNAVLSHIDPAKLNETLGAMSMAFGDRGQTFGQSLTDLDAFLTKLEPSYPRLRGELSALPDVTGAYADAAPDLLGIVKNASAISRTVVDERAGLDRFLVSTIGLAEIGNDVLGANSAPLANLMHLLVPTTDLTSEYREALNCSLTGMIDFVRKPPNPLPGVYDLGALTLGIERYRYPQDLPKVAAAGGPQCKGQIPIQYNTFPPKVVADVGTSAAGYGNQGIVLNSDALKEWLFGPIDGPPRNSAQWGQPG